MAEAAVAWRRCTIFPPVIEPSALLRDFEARYAREAWRGLSYPAALALFAGLWTEAQLLNPEAGDDWEHDLAADFAVARAVNGLPPSA
jgi:hypothetical protein